MHLNSVIRQMNEFVAEIFKIELPTAGADVPIFKKVALQTAID